MKALRKLRYPATPAGRERYVRNGLKPHRGQFCYLIPIALGIIGLIIAFVSFFHDKAHFALVILSMISILLGLHGFIAMDEKEQPGNQKEIDEMIERKKRRLE